MLYYFQVLMQIAFKNHPFGKIVNMHQSSTGWTVIVKDNITGQEYLIQAYPIKSTKAVLPNTVDQLLEMNQGRNNG